MCGRFVITSTPQAMRMFLEYEELPNFPARYNVAPTQPIPVVRLANGRRHFSLMRWGLIPSWVKDPKGFTLLINARAETINEKPAFSAAMKRRRCLIPADGYFEWKHEGARKRAHFVRRKDRAPFVFAGVCETWTGPNGEELDTAAIITTQANETFSVLCDRMPVILPPGAFQRWLDCGTVGAEEAAQLLVPAPDDQMEMFEVGSAVNRVINDDPSLIEPGTTPEPPPAKKRAAKEDTGQASLF
jgi:putative SOS response-associated peptidase YedK